MSRKSPEIGLKLKFSAFAEGAKARWSEFDAKTLDRPNDDKRAASLAMTVSAIRASARAQCWDGVFTADQATQARRL
jgi:hypothetical protein